MQPIQTALEEITEPSVMMFPITLGNYILFDPEEPIDLLY